MPTKHRSVKVGLVFEGFANVQVPAHLDRTDAQILALKIALARALATFENPDAPEEDALDEYADEASPKAQKTAEKDWDATLTEGLSGEWKGYSAD
jgi:hypothetical protein